MSHGSPSSITLPPLRPGPHQSRLATIAFVATFGGLLFGYDTGVINGALDPMREDLGLTVFTEGLVTATLLVGAAVGALIGGRLNNFSAHPMRYKYWQFVSRLNTKHMELAWASLIWLAVADFYVVLLATGTISDLRFF